MAINLSLETVETACNALRYAQRNLRKQLNKENISENKREILDHQLEDVENALSVFEELLEM